MSKIWNFLQRNENTFKLAGARSVVFIALFLLPGTAGAATLDDLYNQIQSAQNKLSQTTSQKKSLQGEVSYYNNQIAGIESQIYATDAEIDRLSGEISATESKIKQAEADLATARGYLSEILRVTYEEGQVSNIELIARSDNFSDFINRSEYMEQMQLKIKDSADKVISLKGELDGKKKSLEDAKKKSVELMQQQVGKRQEVASQRNAKDYLLQLTKGNEAEYQAQVKRLQKEYNALRDSLNGGYVSLGSVKAGDVIGYIGNSGYSTGPHLHFEVWTGSSSGSHTNPNNYIGNGYFINPVPGVWVSQSYGPSSWTTAYSFHTGIDYADGGAGTPIKAAADGEIIRRDTGYGNTYFTSPQRVIYGNMVIIRHTNGMTSLYAHLR